MVRRDCAEDNVGRATDWLKCSAVGRCRRLEEDIEVARGTSEKHLVGAAANLCVRAVAAVDGRGRAFVRLRIAGFVDMAQTDFLARWTEEGMDRRGVSISKAKECSCFIRHPSAGRPEHT